MNIINYILDWFKPKPYKYYTPINNRCWVCGELSKINCPGYHTLEQKKRMIKHYKKLGYTHGIPSINNTRY
jgi:hypothetical protein